MTEYNANFTAQLLQIDCYHTVNFSTIWLYCIHSMPVHLPTT